MTKLEDAPEGVREFIEVTHRKDTVGFLDLFTEDAVIDDWGNLFEGREAIRGWNFTDNIGVRVRYELEDVVVEGERTIVTVTVTGGGFNGTSTLIFTYDGDLISRLEIPADPDYRP